MESSLLAARGIYCTLQGRTLLCPEGPQMARSFWCVTRVYKHDTVFALLRSWCRAVCTGTGGWWWRTTQGSASAFVFSIPAPMGREVKKELPKQNKCLT